MDSNITLQEDLGREQPAKSAEPEEYRTVDGAVRNITISTNINLRVGRRDEQEWCLFAVLLGRGMGGNDRA